MLILEKKMLAFNTTIEFLIERIPVRQHHELNPLLGRHSLHDGNVGQGIGFSIEFADDEFTGHNFYKTDIIGHDKTP